VTIETSSGTDQNTSTSAGPRPVQVHSVYIKATAERIWQAVTDPEWNGRYGYGAPSTFELRPGGEFRSVPGPAMIEGARQMGWPVPETVVDGEVVEADPPRRLVQTWRMLMDEGLKAEGFTRLTYEIDERGEQGTKLTIVHELEQAPQLHMLVGGKLEDTGAGGGWAWVLSDLKSLLETGSRLSG
jgi:uncharacterized protein YndB with AHSA1/START domain